jgi:HAD superfamily hydrolase (TIGR01509 family)|tara:strand:+ start:1798 stop:2409 length:612 start_codon:yes stop_codon:yes gene_type:complete
MKNKCVLFDLDGVLVDACDWHYEALNRALKEVAYYEISRQDHYEKYNGLPTLTKLSMLNDMGVITDEDVRKISDVKQEHTIKVIEELCKRDQSKVELMRALKDNGYEIAVVTNSIRKTATLMLSNSGVLPFVDLLISNEDTDRNKPYPDPYIIAIHLLNSSHNKTIIVEDSPKGIKAAKDSGAHVLEVKDATEVNLELFKDFI